MPKLPRAVQRQIARLKKTVIALDTELDNVVGNRIDYEELHRSRGIFVPAGIGPRGKLFRQIDLSAVHIATGNGVFDCQITDNECVRIHTTSLSGFGFLAFLPRASNAVELKISDD